MPANFGHLLRGKIQMIASADLDGYLTPGRYAVTSPTNGPSAGDFVVDVSVAIEADTTRHTLQTAFLVSNGTTSIRVFNGTSWMSWTTYAGGGGGGIAAADVSFDNTVTSFSATDVQAAVDELWAYANALIAAADAMVFQGVIDASVNPNYPAADAGDTYKISVAGLIGGGSGVAVEVGDMIICTVDSTASGTQAGVGANWGIIQTNIDGAVVGPSSATDNHFAQFDGTSGKLIKGGISLDVDDTLAADSDTVLPSQQAVKAYADAGVVDKVVGPGTITDANFAQFDGTTGLLLKAGLSLDVDDTLAANSDVVVPSQQAVKAYADTGDAAAQAAAEATAAAAAKLIILNEQTGTSYILLLTDSGKTIEMNNAAANTCEIPLNATAAIPVGTVIEVVQIGAGQTQITVEGGVTLLSKASEVYLAAQYSAVTLYKRATDTWVMVGDLTTP